MATTDSEAKDIIGSIPVLRDMFLNYPAYTGDLFGDHDNTDGILYLSRLNADDHRPTKTVYSGDDGDNDPELTVDKEETKSSSSIKMTASTRNKKRRFAMSLTTLAMKPHKRHIIVEEGAVPALIDLSQLNDAPIKKCCAAAFSSLATEASIRQHMIESGAFAAIIALSSTSSRSVKRACCAALCNLCCENGYEYRAVKEGAPYALVQIAAICPENTGICLQTLLNITCVTDKFARVEEVTDALLHFFSLKLQEEELIVVMSAFCNLSAMRNNQLRLVEDGLLRVIERANKNPSTTIRSISSQTLRNLTTDARTRSKLMDQFVLVTLVGMARDEVDSVRLSCVHAFYNLSKDNACREKIVSGNAVGVIIRMSMEKMSDVDMGRTASKTLRILCGDKVLAHKLVGDGIVKALMSLIKTDDGTIRQYCAESICSLFQSESVLNRLIEQGAVNVLVSLSQNDMDVITGEWCAFALFQLSTNDFCPVYLLANGILPCLIKLCKSPSERSKKFCGAALWSITIKKSVDVSSAIPVLVHMLRHETNQSIKVDCASALYNLADNDSNCDQMLSAGALIPVVKLTKADYLETKIKCAAILSRLSCHDKYYKEFASDDVLKVLLELSRLEHALTQRRVVIAVSNLSQFAELRMMLLDLQATEFIISLASKPDEHIRRGCAAIICNMSYEEGSEQTMLRDGVVKTLLITALVTSDQLQTKLICAKALVNLMYDPTSYATMVDDGVIWGLGNLTLLDNTDILNMCAKALCNLSCQYARQMLSSSSTVNAIMKLLKQEGNIELQRYSGRILTNLLMQTTDADEDFRREAVNNMLVMSSCKDKEVSEMCIFCLCLASQSESCRANIVSSGILRLIDVSSIFNDPSVSYAYLTMFGNIANNPLMRTQVLDDQCISRFMTICKSNDPNLDLAVINALYCLSCATENLSKLVLQNSLRIVETIWLSSFDKSSELIRILVAFMYNLTTEKSTQKMLVSQGIVRLFKELWTVTKEEKDTVLLSITSICHLACGNVNTALMVREGCTEILCFLSQYKNSPKYAHYNFSHELVERCSAAFRNLCISIPNQETMVEVGAIDAIVQLITLNGESLDDAAFATTRKNCASALRSMTYNIAIRQKLVQSGAILIILQDLTRNFEGDELKMNTDLLCELEAESWCNGSRGQQKEARAAYIDPAPLYTKLLGGTSNVNLDVDKISVDQRKFLVKVYLEEPPIETLGALKALEDGFHNLNSFTEDEIIKTIPMVREKNECRYSSDPNSVIRRITLNDSKIADIVYDEDDEDDDDTTVYERRAEASGQSALEIGSSFVSSNSGKDRSMITGITNGSYESEKSTKVRFMEKGKVTKSSSSSLQDQPERVQLPSLVHASKFEDEDDGSCTSTQSRLLSSRGESMELAHLAGTVPTTKKKAPRMRKASSSEFKGLVALINHSKKNKGNESNVDGVLKRWTVISKY
eukprot:CAMPEP_0185041812 /NCGR_PEP_ID=MMETSP1103-20130426/41587_1 /TAXON_ID=36769 /ORGANISM="Paraphysomonas bandaiensis, Strain Caron Lab Isolate" /LENGTH=1453 /DNA_ID=CAMNT_0027581715 /DNA_START=6 /DNA_END=4367 /DNA_ORIENTATION=+